MVDAEKPQITGNGPFDLRPPHAADPEAGGDIVEDGRIEEERLLEDHRNVPPVVKIAMARKADNETAEWPWYRLVLFWHFYLPTATRMMVAAIAFFIFWAALTLRLAGIQRSGVNAVLILAAITMILFGSSVAVSWHQETTASAYQLPQLAAPR